MNDTRSITDPFDTWVASRGPATRDTFFLYHQWIEQTDLHVLAHRPDGEIIYLNTATAELIGVRRRELVGSQFTDVIGHEWFEEHDARVRRANPENAGFSERLRLEGTIQREFEIKTTVLFNSAGAPGVVWLVLNDITDLLEAQDELHEVNVLLRESNRDLEDFAHVASHDLQEPLRKIAAFGSRLRSRIEGDLDEQSLDYLDRMDDATTRMQTLINDLLSFSRIATRGREPVPVDLELVVRHVLHDLEVAIGEADAEIHCGLLPTIDGDPVQLGQLFQNLIGNALKFRRPDLRPQIWVESVMVGGRWLLSVRDNGIGFDQVYAEKIFTVFQRLHGRSQYEGTGVGLAICRKIVERHGGTIRATSHDGTGASFLIDLPRSVGDVSIAA